MSCSVRKKGPKWVSKYSFSRRAWLLGADQRSTGLVVTWTNTRPEEHVAIKTREKKITQPGFRTQKEPHCVKSRLKQPSNAAPSGSQQDASPGRVGEGERVEVKSRVIPESWNRENISCYCMWWESIQHNIPPPSATYLLWKPPFLPAHNDHHPHPIED